ncbi:MAG: phosphoribosylformylglycinamidine synthase [Anaeroplasmataceae bacterium]
MDYRVYVEKLPRFQVEANSLKNEFNLNLNLNLKSLRLINVYDLSGFSRELLEATKYTVFGETVTDNVSLELDLKNKKYVAVEYLPGQFDQRASSAVDCVKLVDPNADVIIKSSKLVILDDDVTEEEILKIKKYFINAVEAREKDLNVLSFEENVEIKPVPVLEGLTKMVRKDYASFIKQYGLAMNEDDLDCVVNYFKAEGRDPYETELRILDTYWSDHCRHTTFGTVLESITIEESFIKQELEDSLDLFYKMKEELNRGQKDVCLMEMATIGARYLKKKGYLDDLEVSEENNACSIFVDVKIDDRVEKWLLQFKNETHNHPTEIEPFGGASTCLGGAIRDPLSGRAYVYQAMRVTGAGNIYADVKDTIKGKLPQRIITTKAASGYSSYGNQIGLATTHVREIFHEGYTAKRLEVGAVVGASKASDVRRVSPAPGDVVLMFGGRTGRDGIGGATGSSKTHNIKSIETCSSEVQKGNAPEERKIQRLFRNPNVTKLIKKSNDFGAGGVSVAIGELADGLEIYLDRVCTKYKGLNPTELAISESQERMSVVVDPKDKDEFIKYCHEENLEVIHIANVTEEKRLVMYYKDKKYVDIARSFIDSAGAKHYAKALINTVENKNPFVRNILGDTLQDKMINNLSSDNVVSQKGLIEMFDATIGCSTVLMPFGGKYQRTETQVSVQKLPVLDGYTDLSSIMAFGYNPYISQWSPYHGSQYAVIEACAKVVAAGARYDKMRFSYQEYFERMVNEASWGKPLASLLGAIKIQNDLKLPSIGGKDSMSGTFDNLNVPPMLMAFGITTVDANNIISPEFKRAGNMIYLVKHNPLENYNPNIDELKNNFDFVSTNIENKKIVSAYAIGAGGVSEALAKMAFGNKVGAKVNVTEDDLFNYSYGSIVVEATEALNYKNAIFLGFTSNVEALDINENTMKLDVLYDANTAKFNKVYKDSCVNNSEVYEEVSSNTNVIKYQGERIENPVVFIPVFPGTNCDYDTAKAFKKAGAVVNTMVFRNLTSQDVLDSIKEMADNINKANILAFAGGFSAGDEPDGSAKFIANTLNNELVKNAIHALIDRGGLIIGICNGFQALVKSGLLPYGRLGMVTNESPTLFRNDINRHISQMVTTKVATVASPWLNGFKIGDTHTIAMSHGEGKFVVSEEMAHELFKKGQVAFQYVDEDNNVTAQSPQNPNGSSYAIEGIISENGQILGKMGHTERYENNLFKNIIGNKEQQLFINAVKYFRKEI